MNKVRLGFIGLVIGIAWIGSPTLVGAQERVTLYSINKYRNERRLFVSTFAQTSNRNAVVISGTERCMSVRTAIGSRVQPYQETAA